MTPRACGRCLLVSLALLVAVVVIAATTELDQRFADFLFDSASARWPLGHEGWMRALAYEGPKRILVGMAVVLLAGIVFPSWLQPLRLARREAVFLLVCLAAVPLLIASIKYSSGVVCAAELARYGGDFPDSAGHFGLSMLLDGHAAHGCWPSGHASGGYALLALGLLERAPGTRRLLWGSGALAGSIMGAYQVARGAHFVSHVLVTALLAQLIVCAIGRTLHGWVRAAGDDQPLAMS